MKLLIPLILYGCADHIKPSLQERQGKLDAFAIQMGVQAMTSHEALAVNWTAIASPHLVSQAVAQEFYDQIEPLAKSVKQHTDNGIKYPFRPFVVFSVASRFLASLQASHLFPADEGKQLIGRMLDYVKDTVNKPVGKTDSDDAFEQITQALGENKQTDKVYKLYATATVVYVLDTEKNGPIPQRVRDMTQRIRDLAQIVIAEASSQPLKAIEEMITRLTHVVSDHVDSILLKQSFDGNSRYGDLGAPFPTLV